MESSIGGDFMNLYDSNVKKVLYYLNTEQYNQSTISGYRVFYRDLRKFLVSVQRIYSMDLATDWVANKTENWSSRKISYAAIYLQKLNDFYEIGTIREEHQISTRPVYINLLPQLRKELDDFLKECETVYSPKHLPNIKIRCSRFLMFLQKHGIQDVSEITYCLIKEFHITDWHKSSCEKEMYEACIRSLLYYMNRQGKCTVGFALLLNNLRFSKILSLNELPETDTSDILLLKEESLEFLASEFWEAVQEFKVIIDGYGYADTMKNSCDCTLSLLFLFLDMHELGYHPEIVDIWFRNASHFFGTNWKMSRRVIKLFEKFTKEGCIFPQHKFTYGSLIYDSIPDWCKPQLSDFLKQKEREGKANSTICMYRSANSRFCLFLGKKELKSFSEITPDLLKEFNLTDLHQTAEGKNAYNIRIRRFLFFLEERKIIESYLLHNALPCHSAPKEKVIVTLSNNEVHKIRSFKEDNTSPLNLRKSAMLMLGLRMGLRSSDIVNIKFKDIDWQKEALHILQIKTKVEIVLPIPTETGNAIYRYLKEGRPSSDSQYIFINHKSPYDKITSSVCGSALLSALPDRNVPGSGFHVTRKTFATAMFRRGHKISVISDSLGHKGDGTVHKYLSLDEERMRICPLSLSETRLLLKGGIADV
jgi:site-specific recombinase XerD